MADKLAPHLEESAAILTTYNLLELTAFGFTSLNEILRSTPGYDVRDASWLQTNATRGLPGASLLLIDGTVINSPLTNAYPSNVTLDIGNYKRVETISGPGGVLWGAHSLLGVVNLISLDGADINGVTLRTDVGSFGQQRYAARAGKRFGDLDVYVAATASVGRGQNLLVSAPTLRSYPFGGRYDVGGEAETSNKTDYAIEMVAKVRYKYFTLLGRLPYSKQYYQLSEEGGLLGYRDNGFRQEDTWTAALTYAQSFLGGDIRVLAKAYANRYILTFNNRLWGSNAFYPGGFGMFQDGGNVWKLGGVAEGRWNFNLKRIVFNTLIGGVDAGRESVGGAKVSFSDGQGLYGDFKAAARDAAAHTVSAYVNDDLAFVDRVSLSGGLRYNYSDSYASVLLLGAGVVGRVVGRTYLKLGVTTGMRPPALLERYGLAPAAAPLGEYQDPKAIIFPMAPARSRAYQVEAMSRLLTGWGPVKDLSIRADFASTLVEGMRSLVPNLADPGVVYYLPIVDRQILSAEARLEARFVAGHGLWSSYSYNKVSFSLVDATVPQTGPRHAWSFGGTAKLHRMIRAGVRLHYESGTQAAVLRIDANQPNGGLPALMGVKPIFTLNAGINVEGLWNRIDLGIWGYNLTNQQYSHYVFTNVFAGGAEDGQAIQYPAQGAHVLVTAQVRAW